MRSQATKPLPKKSTLNKTSSKVGSVKNNKKKPVTPKKIKNLINKSLVASPKKSISKDDITNNKNEEGSSAEKKDSGGENSKPGSSKGTNSRSGSPSKKCKKDSKEKKTPVKNKQGVTVKKTKNKKATKTKKPKKSTKSISNNKEDNKDKNNEEIKYKINCDVAKTTVSKVSKAKTIVKKGNTNKCSQKKKCLNQTKCSTQDVEQKEVYKEIKSDKNLNSEPVNVEKLPEQKIGNNEKNNDTSENKKEEEKKDSKVTENSVFDNISSPTRIETPKPENERPPKFFTSSRSPRMVDIDVKCCKNSKGNLSVSERFLSMKCESKNDDINKDKLSSNALISQGPEIDVYTFTEKVDSPKSILSDFRSPINKNIGRVRPIARVKGTVIDKKLDSEKKKYSPHRPIEEVVKQLKNKRCEELNTNQIESNDASCSVDLSGINTDKDLEDKPKPIVSKSYKMVARKSSITGKPFSPIKFFDNDPSQTKIESNIEDKASITLKKTVKPKKQQKKSSLSDEELDNSKFALNTKAFNYTSSEESVNESNDDNDTKESSESETSKGKKSKNKKYKRITDSAKKTTSKELRELSKDSLIDLKDDSLLLGNEKPSKRRLKLLSMWTGPKKHRMASLNAIAKVHCLYENESRTHMELGLMKTVDRQVVPSTSKPSTSKKKDAKVKETEKTESNSESEYENNTKEKKDTESSDSSDDNPPQRTLRGVPGIRSAGKYWDPKSSSSSSEDSELEYKNSATSSERKKISPKATKTTEISCNKLDTDKPSTKMKKTLGVPVKKKRNRNEVVMDLKDMVVQKRMASLNATAILAASYEKRSPKSNKDETTSDSCSDDSYSQKSKNGVNSGVKSETRNEENKKESDDASATDRKQKVEVIVNQDTDVTITGVYSTHHHEGFCTVSGMQYRISSTSHTQTTATANCEQESCGREDGARYTPLSALSSMQPPTEQAQSHPHTGPVPEIGGLARRAGCSSAFSAPSPAAHHEPGYYQPAGPLIKESSADAERALARYHPPPHYHAPHPPVLQQYGPPYYPAELCYGRYYRPPGPYHMPPTQSDPQMVGVGSDPYPPPQYYGTPPCYQHSPQRIPYVEYRGCSCPINACPKNVHIGPATGKAPTSGGPDVPSALAHTGGAFRPKVRQCALDTAADTHGSGKDPPLEPEPPAATDAPHPCPLPAIGGASPKRELYDVRDNLRMTAEIRGPVETIGPPSPARGSAGACAPQPPPVAPRRARLGKAMARRSLVGDDTGLLLSAPQPLPTHHSDADDDVMAISPPACAPIDLSSSDERSTPLVDIKKENEGPTYSSPRKTDAQALREHNCSMTLSDGTEIPETAKSVKRRYSKPKLEIDMKDVQLEDSCKTNGIGEHVKLQKRRKVSSEQTEVMRTETVTKDIKKKTTPKTKRISKSPTEKKSTVKRKIEHVSSGPKPKKVLVDATLCEEQLLKTVAAVTEEATITKPKNKSALLLDNLIRKNSIDRKDSTEKEINPAELFLSPNENISQSCGKNAFNINNNIVHNSVSVNGVRPNTIAAVTQHLGKKLANKTSCKIEKVDSKITQTVLKSPTEKMTIKDDNKLLSKLETNIDIANALVLSDLKSKEYLTDKCEVKDNINNNISASEKNNTETAIKQLKIPKNVKANTKSDIKASTEECIEKNEIKDDTNKAAIDRLYNRTEKILEKPKRCKLVDKTKGDGKGKSIEKVAKLLVSKKPAIKTDEAALLVEDACASPIPSTPKKVGKRARRRRSGALLGTRRQRRVPAPLTPLDYEPRTPRWNNGWKWDGEHYLSKVYLNNDSRLDKTARCWSQMTHKSGDQIARGDCVLLRASSARAQPFVARIARLWENPDDGEMMVSLVWYYRPEHTERGRGPADAPDEVFASRHRDANSVACIEDKCYVLTFNEYCRYRKRLKAQEEGITIGPSLVPPMPASEMTPIIATNDSKLPAGVSQELVLFCRKIYDFRSKKIQVPNK